MDVPGIVRERLGDERRMTSVNIGGDDRVYVTPPRTLVYHSPGLFSREEIEEFPHDAARFDVSADRREASFAFEYDDGVRGFSTPRERIETVLPPVLAGVLRTTGRIADDESVIESYRFGQQTLVVTEARVLTSAGEAVWEAENESYAYAEVTDLRFDDGALVVAVGDQSRRIELSGDGGADAYRTVEEALLAYRGVESLEQLSTTETESPRRTQADEWATMDGEGTDDVSAPEAAIGDAEAASTGEASAEPPQRPSSPAPSGQSAGVPVREVEGTDTGPGRPSDATTDAEPSASDGEETERDSDNEDDHGIEGDHGIESVGTEGATDSTDTTGDAGDVGAELDALRETVERQTELLERQQETIERLVKELSYDQ